MNENLPSTFLADEKLVQTLKNTLCKDLTNEEFQIVCEFCKSTGLNPFKKEIWPIKNAGKLQLMTGLNGYLAIANRHPQFDGMEIIVDQDQNGVPTRAICKVHRKDRKYPSVGIALMKEFRKQSPIWSQMPTVMLTKVAKSIALREAFPQELGGTYTEEEMPKAYSQGAIEVSSDYNPQDGPPEGYKAPITEDQSQTYYYDLATIKPALVAQAETYLIKNGASKNEQTNLWMCDKELPKMERFLVTHTMQNGEIEPIGEVVP